MYIFGCGGHSKVSTDIATECGIPISGYVVSQTVKAGHKFIGHDVVSESELLKLDLALSLFVAVGEPHDRAAIVGRFKRANRHVAFPSLIHPSAVVSERCKVGDGVFIGPLAVVNAGAEVGDFAIINSSAIVEHDCMLGQFVFMGPGSKACGDSRIAKNAVLGAGSILLPGVEVGETSTLAAGSTLRFDLPPNSLAAGSPASVKKQYDSAQRTLGSHATAIQD